MPDFRYETHDVGGVWVGGKYYLLVLPKAGETPRADPMGGRHGTETAYAGGNYGYKACRCNACKAAHAAAETRRHDKRWS